MRTAILSSALLVPALALAACGGGKANNVDTATYTCGQFNKSLATKGDDSAGNFINQLVKDANLGQSTKIARREITLAIYFACQRKPGSTTPKAAAIIAAKQMKAGTFKPPAPTSGKKKSNK